MNFEASLSATERKAKHCNKKHDRPYTEREEQQNIYGCTSWLYKNNEMKHFEIIIKGSH
jgi:hypothetical protein